MTDITPTKAISIQLPGQNTIYATPDSGNVLGAPKGITVTWTCVQEFQITFFALDGSRTDIPKGPTNSEKKGVKEHQVIVTFPAYTYVKYVVQAYDPVTGELLTLDPHIGVDH